MNWSISIPRSISGSQRVRMICWGPSTVFTMKALSAQPWGRRRKVPAPKRKSGLCICMKDNQIISKNIEEALIEKNENHDRLYQLFLDLA